MDCRDSGRLIHVESLRLDKMKRAKDQSVVSKADASSVCGMSAVATPSCSALSLLGIVPLQIQFWGRDEVFQLQRLAMICLPQARIVTSETTGARGEGGWL